MAGLQVFNAPQGVPNSISVQPLNQPTAPLKVSPLSNQPAKISVAPPANIPSKISVQPLPQQPSIYVPPKPPQMDKIASDIDVARGRGADDITILKAIIQKNPDLAPTVQTAIKERGATPSDVLNAIVAKHKPQPQDAKSDEKSVGGFLENVVRSAKDTAGNLLDAVIHPIDTIKGTAKLAVGEINKLDKVAPSLLRASGLSIGTNLLPESFKQESDQTATAVNQFYKDRYGGWENIKNTLYNDPVGVALDVASVLEPAGAVLGKVGTASKIPSLIKAGNVVQKSGEVVNPVRLAAKATSGTTKLASTLAKYGTSQATGLEPKTINTIINNTKEFAKKNAGKYSRESIGQEVFDGITARVKSLSETGKGYDVIRKSGQSGNASASWFMDALKKEGFVDDAGKFKPTKLALLTDSEKSAVRKFIDTWGKDTLKSDEFLDGRAFLDDKANWQQGVSSDAGTRLFRSLRSEYDNVYGKQFKGLKDLDAQYGPEAKLLKKIRKDYFNSDGTFKDNALSKLANLTKEGRQQVLSRLEQIMPEVGQKIDILNAIEDIERTAGNKVGTYSRAAIAGAAAYTLNPSAIVAAVLAHPKSATLILRGYGRLKGLSQSAIASIKAPPSIERIKNVVRSGIDEYKNSSMSDEGGFMRFKSPSRQQAQAEWNRLQQRKIKLINEGAKESSPAVRNIIRSQKLLEKEMR